MELYQLRYFLSVAAHRNITRAAADCGVTQTAMSEQMRKLEASIGAVLLSRGRRQTTLTEAGRALAEHAETLLRQAGIARDAVTQIAGMHAGRLTLGVIPSVGAGLLPEAFKRFHALHRAVQIVVREETSARIAQLVESGEVDVGVAQLPLARGSFQAHRLLQESFHALLPRAHALAGRTSIRLAELAEEHLILPRGRARQSALEACRKAGFEPRLACESAEFDTIRALVASGLGVALVPALAARGMHPGITSLPLSGGTLRRNLVFLTSKRATPPEAAARFLEILRACVAGQRGGSTGRKTRGVNRSAAKSSPCMELPRKG
jgi:DNA-binding transcriptional LysR family regulator